MQALTTSPLVKTYTLKEFWELPGAAIYDRNTKADTYAALGVRELWLVDPENEIVEVRNLKPAKKGRKGVYGPAGYSSAASAANQKYCQNSHLQCRKSAAPFLANRNE